VNWPSKQTSFEEDTVSGMGI